MSLPTAADIKSVASKLGAVLCGISPADRFGDVPEGHHPCDVLPECKSVIVFALKFDETFLNTDLPAYTNERNRLREATDTFAEQIAEHLASLGLAAYPILYKQPPIWEAGPRLRANISLKHAGMLAGLGKIGKNTLLLNDKYGNMIWLGAVLTDAVLDADLIAEYDGCIPECRICIDACPVKALHSDPINQLMCWNNAFSYNTGAESILCCDCRKVCPNNTGIQR